MTEIAIRQLPAVLSNGSRLQIEVSDLDGSSRDPDTEAPVAGLQALPFRTITPAIEGLATEMVQLLQRIGPSAAAIEFGIEMGLESGQLTAILVKGTGKANLKVTLHWDHVKSHRIRQNLRANYMSIFDRVRDCTVRISEIGDKGRTGTGFFVAPGCVLTCAHVIEPSPNGQPGEFNIESQFGHWRSTPEAWRPASHSDIALLSITSTAHPCVLFGATAEPRDPVWSQGFIDRQGEVRLEPFIGEIEGERRARLQVGGRNIRL